MRELATEKRISEFMGRFARNTRVPVNVYFTGGTTAVLLGWRDATIDIDLRFEPEVDELYRAIPKIKEDLRINVELAWPPDFIPQLPGWQERCRFIERVGTVSFHHYDPYSQALSKIERGHEKDVLDAEAMLKGGLIDLSRLLELFEEIRPMLYKYPAIDPATFSRAVEAFFSDHQ
jgi:hypothetical protein